MEQLQTIKGFISRELKFRAWNPFKNQFTNKGFISCFSNEKDKNYTLSGLMEQPIEDWNMDFEKYILTQFTGQKDANGVEIFEGDIVKTHDDWDTYKFQAGEINLVYFGFGGFRLKAKNPNAKGYWLEDGNDVVVIGNIFENPELLPQSE